MSPQPSNVFEAPLIPFFVFNLQPIFLLLLSRMVAPIKLIYRPVLAYFELSGDNSSSQINIH